MNNSKEIEQERDQARVNVSLAFVNGHITQSEAGQAITALEEHWSENDHH